MIKSAAQRQRGFTLLEIMISLVLICLSVVSLIELSSANLRNLASSDSRIEELSRANDKMRDVLERDTLEESSWQENDSENYACDVSIQEIEKARSANLAVRLMQITVTVQNKSIPGAKTFTLKTAKMISKADDLKRKP